MDSTLLQPFSEEMALESLERGECQADVTEIKKLQLPNKGSRQKKPGYFTVRLTVRVDPPVGDF